MKIISKKFDSLSAFSYYCSSFQVGYERDPEFTGSKSYNEANKLLINGWRDGADRVAAYMSGGVRGRVDQAQNYYSPVGFAPSVGRYLTGHPCNMINRRRVSVPAPVVTIAVQTGFTCGYTADDALRAFSKLFNVVVGLERSGVRVELWALNVGKHRSRMLNLAIKIKSAGQPFNLLKMVYPCCHPSFHRRHCFHLRDNLIADVGGSIYEESDLKEYAALNGVKTENIFTLPSLEYKTEQQIKEMIK